MPIDRRFLVDAIFAAVETFITTYNETNDTQVGVDLEGDEIIIDGGHVNGTFTVSVVED